MYLGLSLNVVPSGPWQEEDETLRILFGPEHDALHVDPDVPGAYEWWYFDALSDDGRWALVVIYLLGSPMSPYYKAAAVGDTPSPRDWCGVFVSLHEKIGGRWQERAYAYNLYHDGAFAPDRPDVTVGDSRMTGAQTKNGWQWRLDVREAGLWRGKTRAQLLFTTTSVSAQVSPLGDKGDTARHTWVCVAPHCRVEGVVTPPSGRALSFTGAGYHDHNFGNLPLDDTDIWYWGRAVLRCSDQVTRVAVFYHLDAPDGQAQSVLLLFGPDSAPLMVTDQVQALPNKPIRNAYGLVHATRFEVTSRNSDDPIFRLSAQLKTEQGTLSEGPFYRRLGVSVCAEERRNGLAAWAGTGDGLGEVFRPTKLCGPIASRALWSRIRRRPVRG